MELISEAYHIDCVEYMRELPDKYFTLAVADPPYGQAGKAGWADGRFGGGSTARFFKYRKPDTGSGLAVAWDTAPMDEFFTELRRVSCHQVIWGGNFFALPPCKCFLVWVKSNIPDGFNMAQAEYAWTSLGCNSKVFHGSSSRTSSSAGFHPTEKPVALYRWLLRDVCTPAAMRLHDPLERIRVFDPMMGTQSSRVAAALLGIDYYGCEIDAEYYRQGCEFYARLMNTAAPEQTRPQPLQLSLF